MADGCSQPLGLRLAVEGSLIAFYRQDTGDKLLILDELAAALYREAQRRQQAEQRAAAEQELEALRERLRDEPLGRSLPIARHRPRQPVGVGDPRVQPPLSQA